MGNDARRSPGQYEPRQLLRATWDQSVHDRVLIRASGLAYSSLLATVPLAAVLFALFTAFAAFGDLRSNVESFLYSQLLPTRQAEIATYITQFTANTGKLGFIGFVLLILASLALLDAIEGNFNDIWHVRNRRRLVSKLTAYTSLLVFGTLLIGVSLTAWSRIVAVVQRSSQVEVGLLSSIVSTLFPPLLALLSFFVMFLVIPNTRVRTDSAFFGAVVTTALWEIGKLLFTSSIGHSVRYSALYGSLAIIPIFLIWLYIAWVIILVGAELVFSHQHLASLVGRRPDAPVGTSERVLLALRVFAAVAERFHNGGHPPTVDDLAERLQAAPLAVHGVLDALEAAGLVNRVAGDADRGGVRPARPLEKVTATDVIRTVFADVTPAANAPLDRDVESLLAEFQRAGHQAAGSTTFRDLLAVGPEMNREDAKAAKSTHS